ncbi:hypothetical protein QTP88_012910 [Uroleucon formosanum]
MYLHCRKQYTHVQPNKTLALFGTHATDVGFFRSGTRIICDDLTSTNTHVTDRHTETHTYTHSCLCVSYRSSCTHTFMHRTVVLGSSRSASYNRLRRHTPPPPLFGTHAHTHTATTPDFSYTIHVHTHAHTIYYYMCVPIWNAAAAMMADDYDGDGGDRI